MAKRTVFVDKPYKRFVCIKGTFMRLQVLATVTPMVLCGMATVFAVRPAAAQKTGKPWAQSAVASGSPAEVAYAAAITAIVRDYRNSSARHRQRPALASLSIQERRTYIARRTNEMVNESLGYARRLDALKPPARFKAMHEAARAFFLTAAQSIRDFDTAMQAGDRNAANAAMARADRAQQLFSQRCQEAKQASR